MHSSIKPDAFLAGIFSKFFLKTPEILNGQNEISYHVRIIPMTRASIGNDVVLVVTIIVNHTGHRLPGILDVVKVSPNVAGSDDCRVVGLKNIPR